MKNKVYTSSDALRLNFFSKGTKMTNLNIDFALIAKSNPAALRDFVNGASARSVSARARSKKAKAEAYRMERYLTADEARTQAKRFVK